MCWFRNGCTIHATLQISSGKGSEYTIVIAKQLLFYRLRFFFPNGVPAFSPLIYHNHARHGYYYSNNIFKWIINNYRPVPIELQSYMPNLERKYIESIALQRRATTKPREANQIETIINDARKSITREKTRIVNRGIHMVWRFLLNIIICNCSVCRSFCCIWELTFSEFTQLNMVFRIRIRIR